MAHPTTRAHVSPHKRTGITRWSVFIGPSLDERRFKNESRAFPSASFRDEARRGTSAHKKANANEARLGGRIRSAGAEREWQAQDPDNSDSCRTSSRWRRSRASPTRRLEWSRERASRCGRELPLTDCRLGPYATCLPPSFGMGRRDRARGRSRREADTPGTWCHTRTGVRGHRPCRARVL